MISLNNKYVNNRSMNGLIEIYANSIESDNAVVNDTLIIDGEDVVAKINVNSQKLTKISYDSGSDTTTLDSNAKINKVLTCYDEIYIRNPSNPTVNI